MKLKKLLPVSTSESVRRINRHRSSDCRGGQFDNVNLRVLGELGLFDLKLAGVGLVGGNGVGGYHCG